MAVIDLTKQGLGKVNIPEFITETRKPAVGNTQGVIVDSRHSVESVTIRFRAPAKAGGAALHLIAGLMGRGTRNHPSMREIAIRENLLYGCSINWTVKREGDGFNLCLSFSYVSPDRVKSNGFEEEFWSFIHEIMHEPYFLEASFPEEFFKLDRDNYVMYLKQMESDPTSRAIVRSFNQVLDGDSFSKPNTGTVEEAASLDLATLQGLFKQIINKSPVWAAASGSLNGDRIFPHFSSLLGDQARRLGKRSSVFIPKEGIVDIREESPGNADQLVLFFSTNDVSKMKRAEFGAAIALYASSSQSRLYFKLREENQLSYGHFDFSSYEKKLVIIISSVLPKKGELARDLAFKELTNMAENLRDEELTSFKLEFLNSYVKQLDSPFSTAQTLALYLARKKDFNPYKTITRVLRTSKSRIKNIVKDIRPFACYIASGEDGGDS